MHEFSHSDLDRMHAMNEGAVPATGSVDRAALIALVEQAALVPVRRHDERVAAFLILLDETADYASPNYLYFKQQLERFVYVDRVVVDASLRGRGIGRALYADVASMAQMRAAPITCEVNVKPPNPGSMGFHTGLGFEAMGEQETEGGKKRVRLLIHRTPESLLAGTQR